MRNWKILWWVPVSTLCAGFLFLSLLSLHKEAAHQYRKAKEIRAVVAAQRKSVPDYSVIVIVPDRVLRVVANKSEDEILDQSIRDLSRTYEIRQVVVWGRNRGEPHAKNIYSLLIIVGPKEK